MLLNQTTDLSKYTCQWENQIICRSMSYPGTIGGAVPISTYGNRATSGWPLYVTSNIKLPQHSRKMVYEEQGEATSLHISYMVYMIITQARCTRGPFLAVISEERRSRHCRPSTSSSWPREKNLAPLKNAQSVPIWENIHMQEWCNYQSNNLVVLLQLWEIQSGPILIRLRFMHAS